MLGAGHGVLTHENPAETGDTVSALVARHSIISKPQTLVIGNMAGVASCDGVTFKHPVKA